MALLGCVTVGAARTVRAVVSSFGAVSVRAQGTADRHLSGGRTHVTDGTVSTIRLSQKGIASL